MGLVAASQIFQWLISTLWQRTIQRYKVHLLIEVPFYFIVEPLSLSSRIN